jgi:hypothetical protein
MVMGVGYAVIIAVFVVYYALLLIIERKVIRDPSEILDKFLSVILMYAGVSLIYYSITGKPFLNDSPETYNIYIFIIGFIALLWTIPNLLEKFSFFGKFAARKKK